MLKYEKSVWNKFLGGSSISKDCIIQFILYNSDPLKYTTGLEAAKQKLVIY